MSIDVHTHMYLPRYTEMLRGRKELPRVVTLESGEDKILILPGEDADGGAGGRPFNENYHAVKNKLEGMDSNNIKVSVISMANPWLDFMEKGEAVQWSTQLNEDLEQMCKDGDGRLYGFGVLPLQDPSAAAAEVERIAGSSYLRGIIIGTLAAGKGLDDPALNPIWEKLQQHQLTAFVHPHYGIGNSEMLGYGHTLPLALGFPFETTTAVSRLVLSGAFEKYPDLRMLLAHSGGCLPMLAGRIDSCTRKDGYMNGRLPKKPSEYLHKLYYDALCYDKAAIDCTMALASPDQLMFGTDFPFFGHDTVQIYNSMTSYSQSLQDQICFGNASRILNIPMPAAGKEGE
eukprot:NODE_2002_length_1162_cov_113.573913_g1985_i0.p1 GENE.NODE_2002_length_1162_cov_113.573913_g1985_i0~~NODE_2002_length_1162_cov_113.573913_g1985_i0.p1  ORF type:complete len:344 (+),score=90.21 NODE_2002_length_1162_cov_113.573913_g1985_i0:71-1102(+)